MIRIRREKGIKTPSTWSRLSWVERIIYYGGPILIIWICYQIYSGMQSHHLKPDVKETHIQETTNVE